ncbi:hypothetical protein GCM10020220_026370 [Nonomuraea rubra]
MRTRIRSLSQPGIASQSSSTSGWGPVSSHSALIAALAPATSAPAGAAGAAVLLEERPRPAIEDERRLRGLKVVFHGDSCASAAVGRLTSAVHELYAMDT